MKHTWKDTIFIISIAMIFIPMVFLGVNTFFPEFDQDNSCRMPIPIKACHLLEDNVTAYENCINEQNIESEKNSLCYDEMNQEREKYDGFKFITILIICLITSFVMLYELNRSIKYGLFTGVVITAFISTIRYLNSRSLIGFLLLILLFVIIIYYISKEKK